MLPYSRDCGPVTCHGLVDLIADLVRRIVAIQYDQNQCQDGIGAVGHASNVIDTILCGRNKRPGFE